MGGVWVIENGVKVAYDRASDGTLTPQVDTAGKPITKPATAAAPAKPAKPKPKKE